MTTYSILREYVPEIADIPLFSQSGFFFNELEHLRQQQNGNISVVYVLNHRTNRSEARCAFSVCTSVAQSPGAAPFGSVEFTETLPDSVLEEFLEFVQNTARSAGAHTLKLINYPHCYAGKQAERLTRALLKQGFRIIESNQNFFLPVSQTPFESNLKASERRRLRKCREAGFQFTHWLPPDAKEVARFLQETRTQKGYQLSLGPERVIALLQAFPHQFPVFTVRHDHKLIALTVAVRVRHDILYSFLPASHPDYQLFSPMVMLTDGIVTFCQQQTIRLLDLGVSLDANRQPKLSLIRFKQNLGAQASLKLTFEKEL